MIDLFKTNDLIMYIVYNVHFIHINFVTYLGNASGGMETTMGK